jgi:hypothetical protein
MPAGNQSDPSINVHVEGDNNVVVVAGRDVNRWSFRRSRKGQPRPGPSYRRLGTVGAGMLAIATTTLLNISGPDSRPSPPSTWPTEKTAMCKDGSFSESRNRSGTCSRHGGVAYWRYDRDHPIWS